MKRKFNNHTSEESLSSVCGGTVLDQGASNDDFRDPVIDKQAPARVSSLVMIRSDSVE